MSLRDWRQAIRTPPAYRVGNGTLRIRIQTQFVTVISVIGLLALIILYGASSYGGIYRVNLTNDLKLHNEDHNHQHILSQPRTSPIQQDNHNSQHNYNATYPLTKPMKSKMGIKYRVGIISDLDTASKRKKDEIWVSYYHRGYLLWNPLTRKASVTWDSAALELGSAMAQGGRAMELSELVTFDGRLLTLDDRTGVVYEIVDQTNPRVVPWVLLPDGDGHVSKGFKSEWATVCHQQLYVGGLGKEWTTGKGELVNLNPMFVKRVSSSGAVEHLNWRDNYIALRRILDIEFPGYMIHEAVNWSDIHKRWFFLPRRSSKERYNENEDEKKGTNILLSANKHFTDIQVSYVGEVIPTHGFSSFKFIPDTKDEVILALKSSEEAGKTATFITVFTIQGQVLLPETKVADLKYEGIEFISKLLRGPVYLAGESVECSVTFRNPLPPEHARSQSNSDVFENLAWASVQIHCLCTVNENKVSNKQKDTATPEDLATVNADTSYAPCRGERGEMVLATKPKIIFCDLRLSTGESKTFLYSEILPSEAPPSFRGQSVKYSYKLTVGVQRVNMPIRLLKVPLRVLVIQGLSETCLYGESEELTPSNPFLENQQKESALDVALQELQNITARRSPNFYNITNSRGKVVRFCLFKQAYKLGEDIVGTFDFSDAAVACVQLSVALQSEEEVISASRCHPNQKPAVVVYSKAHEVCLGLMHSHLSLPIPLYLAPTFSTSLVSLKWRLHFEFVTSLDPNLDVNCVPENNENSATWQGHSSIPIETMVWDLPVTIYPSNPQLVSQGIRAQCKHTALI